MSKVFKTIRGVPFTEDVPNVLGRAHSIAVQRKAKQVDLFHLLEAICVFPGADALLGKKSKAILAELRMAAQGSIVDRPMKVAADVRLKTSKEVNDLIDQLVRLGKHPLNIGRVIGLRDAVDLMSTTPGSAAFTILRKHCFTRDGGRIG